MNKTQVPHASPEPLPELATFLEPFALLFRRHTSRDSMERYLAGLLTDLPHKTCETIANVIAGTSSERLQHLLTDAAWDPLALDEARAKQLLALHPVANGVLVFDDTALPKRGTASVGVARQYSGTPGNIGNYQVVVSAEFLADDPASSAPSHWPVSAHLFLPESWTQDARRPTCVRWKAPLAVVCPTKFRRPLSICPSPADEASYANPVRLPCTRSKN
jgi:SRSO17 transposase